MITDLPHRLERLRKAFELEDIDEVAYHQSIERLRIIYGAATVDTLLEYHDTSSTSHNTIDVAVNAEHGSIYDTPIHIVGHAENINYQLSTDNKRNLEERTLRDYLLNLRRQCRTIQLASIDDRDTNFAYAMRLEQVYIDLHIQRRVAKSQEEITGDNIRSLHLLEVLERIPKHRMMLLGEPGSGKSTFVNFLTLRLAEAALAQRGWFSRQFDQNTEQVARLGILDNLIPMVISPRELSSFATNWQYTRGSQGLFSDFLKEVILSTYYDAYSLLSEELHSGKVIILLDGLDEVVGEKALSAITTIINNITETYSHTPILITCRIRDYQQNPLRQLPAFPTEILAPFNTQQIEAFVRAWYQELAASKRQVLGTPDTLLMSISNRPELTRLAGMPLLLTMMAVMHAGRGELPSARALLYDECIKLLLLRWRKAPGMKDVLELLQLPSFGPADLLALMASLGYLAHDNAARTLENEDSSSNLSREQVLLTLEHAFRPYAPGDEHRLSELVNIVLHELAGRNGLLLKRSGEAGELYTFPHRTFQEFLAGDYIRRHRDYRRLALECAPSPHWHESLTLMVAYDTHMGNSLSPAVDLIRALLKGSAIEKILAGELLLVIGRERLALTYDPTETKRGGLWGTAVNKIAKIAHGGTSGISSTLRMRAGRSLGLLEYGSIDELTHGSLPTFSDPYLPLTLVLWSKATKTKAWQTMWDHYWCVVEPGNFWSGDDRTEQLMTTIIEQTYHVARYPITNADYAQFIYAGGYDLRQPWWTMSSQEVLGERTHPVYWDDPQFNHPTQPVVGITWYEAMAYCNWLTMLGYEQEWLPKDYIIRLPTWNEWEYAARHSYAYQYPWGSNMPDTERVNYNNTGIGGPSLIGCFPLGVAVCGAEDMIGNVMEWTCSPWGDWDEYQKDFTNHDMVTFSYTYFGSSKEELGCGVRYGFIPRYWFNGLGFRLALIWSGNTMHAE